VKQRLITQKRLTEVRSDLRHLRESLGVLEEQVSYQAEVADEAESRAVVAQTPLADRERHEARRDLELLRRQRDEAAARIAELEAEQDQLLDRLLG
jgi:hypothetical protein